MTETEPTRIAFVCVQNAGRSQMAYTFAKRAMAQRGLEAEFELITGGTKPADHVHQGVVDSMYGIDPELGDRRPREIGYEELRASDIVITMGCLADDVCPAGWVGDVRDWELDDPAGLEPEAIARIRDEIEERVTALFDELTAEIER